VLEAVDKEIGSSLPLIARISGSEQVDGGLDIGDAVSLARFLQGRNVAALHVASGSICDSPPWYYQHMRLPLGKNLEWAGLIKKEVGVPVIAAGRLGDPATIRPALDAGIVDAVALGRPLVADPDLPRKMRENRDDEVMQCGACLQGCLAKVKSGDGLSCIINPEVGRESVRLRKSDKPSTVVVVGGGPGGMQAALTAQTRGHRVTLFDEGQLGGQFNLSYLPPGKEMMKKPLTSLIRRVKLSHVNLRLSQKASPQDIAAEQPDLVILATGAIPVIPSIPGLSNPLTGQDVLTEKKEAGKRVLIVGGGMVGLETAEFLVKKGHQVTVVELLEDIARDMLPITKKLTVKELEKLGAQIITETNITRFEGKRAFVQSEEDEKLLGEFDSVVVAVGTSPVDDLAGHLAQAGLEVRVIGDAKKPRQIFDAVKEGFEVAAEI
jgi:NADPH-dependent 2,4-dienoyl-CoA reductase/sulfur reductase-like enzyme